MNVLLEIKVLKLLRGLKRVKNKLREAKHFAVWAYTAVFRKSRVREIADQVVSAHLRLLGRNPDDKRRYMCVMDGTCYDLSTGVFTGWAQPLSGRMLELEQVFWPRWTDCSISFLTWGQGEPAAVSRLEIYELDELPACRVPGDPGDGSRREIGVQYEDPCGTGASEGAMNRGEWIDRVVTYARHTGQNLLVYPLVWYSTFTPGAPT